MVIRTHLVDGWFSQLEFNMGVASIKQLPPDQGREVAFAGRSNVGKSSVINKITRRRALARTSKSPGRTRELNFFSYSQDRHLVDLPGYGYAKVTESQKQNWAKLLDHYLMHRQALACLFLVMDIRHPMGKFDTQMLDFARECDLPVHILLNKADKLSKSAATAALHKIQQQMAQDQVSCQLFSALKNTGVEEARQRLADYLYAEATDKKVPR